MQLGMSHRNRDNLFSGRTERTGYAPVSNDARNAEQTRNMFEEENNRQLAHLHGQVSSLKQLTLDINSEITSQNKYLDGMGKDFDSAGGLLDGTLKKMQQMLASGGSKHMCYLVAFVVVVFLLIYFSMKKR